MKKYLLSTLMALGALGGLAVSTPAMACQDGGSGRCGNVGYTGNRDNSAYYSSGYSGGSSSDYSRPRTQEEIEEGLRILQGNSDFAVAFSPSTGAVGVAAYSWADANTNTTMIAGLEDFALASCIDKTNALNTQSYNLTIADKIIRKHGKKSDCQVVKKSDTLGESLIAILRGQKSNGQYALYWTTRKDSRDLFSQQQPEFQQLLAKCQAEASQCEIIGQYGDKTELE